MMRRSMKRIIRMILVPALLLMPYGAQTAEVKKQVGAAASQKAGKKKKKKGAIKGSASREKKKVKMHKTIKDPNNKINVALKRVMQTLKQKIDEGYPMNKELDRIESLIILGADPSLLNDMLVGHVYARSLKYDDARFVLKIIPILFKDNVQPWNFENAIEDLYSLHDKEANYRLTPKFNVLSLLIDSYQKSGGDLEGLLLSIAENKFSYAPNFEKNKYIRNMLCDLVEELMDRDIDLSKRAEEDPDLAINADINFIINKKVELIIQCAHQRRLAKIKKAGVDVGIPADIGGIIAEYTGVSLPKKKQAAAEEEAEEAVGAGAGPGVAVEFKKGEAKRKRAEAPQLGTGMGLGIDLPEEEGAAAGAGAREIEGVTLGAGGDMPEVD